MKTFFVNNWWSFIFNGALAVIYGLLALIIPKEVLEVMVKYTGILILIAGVVLLLIAVYKIRSQHSYSGTLILSVILLAAGGFVTFKTTATVQVIVIVIGFWALLTGLLQLLSFISFNQILTNKWAILLNILLTIGFGIVMIFNPFATARILIVISGMMALFSGLLYFWYAFKMKGLKNKA